MKYKNINEVELFAFQKDDFKERRVSGPSRPVKRMEKDDPSFFREYKEDGLYFSWLGHSSVFLRMSNMNILIDPIFSKYASPIPFVGLKRFEGIELNTNVFPMIDIVLITHNHYDHLDKKTILSLDSKVRHYIVPKGVCFNMSLFGIDKNKITEMEWEQELQMNDLTIISLPTQHDTMRYLVDRDKTLWCSYLLKNEKYTVYDSGDGGFTDYFNEIYKKYGEVDLAIMECGQYNEKWHAIHMFPEESVMAARMLHAKLAVPVHYGAYVLSNHAWNEPPIRFEWRAKELGLNIKIPKLFEMLEL